MIKYTDGSYQLLHKDCNNYYNMENDLLNAEFLSFRDKDFYSLWNKGFGD